ncbi:DUF2335 domain-containing protein [Agrobacterium rhizogenes]|nr:DUF2335 domain-containing protein [Rhizobium rhizogenes]
MDDDADGQEELKQAFEQGVRQLLPQIQESIKRQTGTNLPVSVLTQALAEPMADVATKITIQATSVYAGPMPSPHTMAGYAELYPGAPEQLFQQFRDEQKHRHEWENKALEQASNERARRDIGAYLVAGAGIAAACFLALLGALTAAAILIGAIVLGGGALVLGRQFFASHSGGETQVSIQPDGSNNHADIRTQKAAKQQKQSARPSSQKSRRTRG